MIDITNQTQILEQWITKEKYPGHDPFDALNSPLIRYLTFGSKKISQCWVQLNKISPVNLRPLLGVQKSINPKAMGVFLAAHSRRSWSIQENSLHNADSEATWLLDNTSPGYHGVCWGYNFDWPNRSFYAPAGTPTIVNTGFIGLAFLDYKEALKRSHQPSVFPLQTAVSACEFILHDLNLLETEDEICFSYTPLDRRYVHNANLLGAWLLSAVYAKTSNSEYAEKALRAARFSARRMEPNGSWKYGINSNDGWVDNFHTGYVLVGLNQISRNLGVIEFQDQISQGYEFWKKNFFLSNGVPKYYPNSVYPIDAHSISQAILTFLDFMDIDPEALGLACKVADWACRNMQDPNGFFYYQKHRFFINKIPYMRWCEAWMFRALTDLQIKLLGEHGSVRI